MSVAAVYVSNADSGEIGVFRLDRDAGTVQPVETIAVDGMVMPLAISPDRRVLHAAIRSEPFTVASFSIDAARGKLTAIGRAPLPDSMANIATDRTGRWLFAASYGGSKISVSAIGADGVVRNARTIVDTGKNAHAAIVDPSNRNLLVTNLGSDQVLRLRFDALRGTLLAAEVAFKARAGSGPRHLVFHPNGKYVYLLNELDASVDALAFDSDRGVLQSIGHWSSLPEDADVKAWAADVHVRPDGKFLYTSERNTNTIAIWKVNEAKGTLVLMGHQATEKQPRGFQVDSTGGWLLAVGQESHHMTAYRINAATGLLTEAARLPMGKNPNWVEIVDLA